MKKLFFLFLPLLMSLFSCGDDDLIDMDLANPIDTSSEITDPIKVNPHELTRVIGSHLKNQRRNISRATDYLISVIKDEEGNPKIYCINFLPSKGFLLVSATKNYNPILAWGEKGNFNLDDLPDGVKEWKETTMDILDLADSSDDAEWVKECRRLWKMFERPIDFTFMESRDEKPSPIDPVEYQALQNIFKDSLVAWHDRANYTVYGLDGYQKYYTGDYNQLLNEIKEQVYPLYQGQFMDISFIVEKTDGMTYGTSNMIGTEWTQTLGFNSLFPAVSENGQYLEHAYAGCGPVAAGQVMYHFKWPQTFNWDLMHPYIGTNESSRLLYDIAENCNAEYHITGTSTKNNDIAQYLRSKGYEATYKSSFSMGTVDNSLERGWPVIVGSELVRTSGELSRHAWIIAGYRFVVSERTVEVWTFRDYRRFTGELIEYTQTSSQRLYYINWGWGGYCDGWFANPLSDVPNPNSYTKNKPTSMITNIHPNN